VGKNNLSLVNAETERIKKQFAGAFEKANKTNPKPADVARLREMLSEHHDLKLWTEYFGIMGVAESFLLQDCPAGAGFAELWRRRLKQMRIDLGAGEAPEIERLLIAHATLCYLRLGLVELRYTAVTKNGCTLAQGAYWDRLLTTAQRRFTRSVESLAKVRALAAVAERARGGRGTLPEARTGTAG
jgi:hypothetical protein